MTILFPVLLLLIFAICVAFTFGEGMWGNAVRLVNLVTAGLIAMNSFQPVAKMLDNQVEASLTYFWDFVSIWVLFAVSLLLLRIVTDRFVSRVKVRFLKIADQIGGGVLAACCAWFMVCFTTSALHTAPLGRDFLYGGFTPDGKMFFGLGPDRQWLAFVRHVSKGVYCRGLSDEERRDGRYGTGEVAAFGDNPKLEFIAGYAQRRTALEELAASSGSMRVPGGGPKR